MRHYIAKWHSVTGICLKKIEYIYKLSKFYYNIIKETIFTILQVFATLMELKFFPHQNFKIICSESGVSTDAGLFFAVQHIP